MIKKIMKTIMYVIFFLITLSIFLPKLNMYYLIEKELLNSKVILSDETFEDNLLSLDIKQTDIYYNGLKFSKVKNINLKTFLIFSEIDIAHVKIDEQFISFIPPNINEIVVTHSIFNPLESTVVSNGDFGILRATINFLNRKIYVNLTASSTMKNRYKILLNQMKLEEGVYKYEYKF